MIESATANVSDELIDEVEHLVLEQILTAPVDGGTGLTGRRSTGAIVAQVDLEGVRERRRRAFADRFREVRRGQCPHKHLIHRRVRLSPRHRIGYVVTGDSGPLSPGCTVMFPRGITISIIGCRSTTQIPKVQEYRRPRI